MQESLAAMMFIMYIFVVVVMVNHLSGGRFLSIRLKITKPGSLDTKLVKYWEPRFNSSVGHLTGQTSALILPDPSDFKMLRHKV